jgi:hypothetical protein
MIADLGRGSVRPVDNEEIANGGESNDEMPQQSDGSKALQHSLPLTPDATGIVAA